MDTQMNTEELTKLTKECTDIDILKEKITKIFDDHSQVKNIIVEFLILSGLILVFRFVESCESVKEYDGLEVLYCVLEMPVC